MLSINVADGSTRPRPYLQCHSHLNLFLRSVRQLISAFVTCTLWFPFSAAAVYNNLISIFLSLFRWAHLYVRISGCWEIGPIHYKGGVNACTYNTRSERISEDTGSSSFSRMLVSWLLRHPWPKIWQPRQKYKFHRYNPDGIMSNSYCSSVHWVGNLSPGKISIVNFLGHSSVSVKIQTRTRSLLLLPASTLLPAILCQSGISVPSVLSGGENTL